MRPRAKIMDDARHNRQRVEEREFVYNGQSVSQGNGPLLYIAATLGLILEVALDIRDQLARAARRVDPEQLV